MPGILVMNHSAPDVPTAPQDAHGKKRDHEGQTVNKGWNEASKGASPTNGAALAVSATASADDMYSQPPPEIAQIPEEAYNSLSALFIRISQECYNDLSHVLQNMTDIPLAPQTNGVMPNGLGHHNSANNQADAKANAEKKLLMTKFAQDSRAKFIKLLVLTEWGKKAVGDISILINLYAWTREQSVHMEATDFALDSIRRYAKLVGENNPDITTALEILSTGKAPWMPSLDFIPPEPVSSEQALKLLRYMNTSLSIRLNVHEKLPRHLHNWHIHSGRATFVIQDEFEFDVMSFVEDLSDQWLFIDLRLLFSPAPSILVGSRFFAHLKTQADFTLREKGLTGLFDFLNNFVLTHKISVLRSQALALTRTEWSELLRVEPVHRELVVQYWIDRPGKKNWVEIGVCNNKPRSGKFSWRGQPIPSVKLRWFRQGKEMTDMKFELDWKNLSMERVLKRVIARHTGDILQQICGSLNSNMKTEMKSSATEPTDCSLNMTLGTSNTAKLSLEPITGNFILLPASAPLARAEYAINQGRESAHIGNIILQTLAQSLMNSVQRGAQQLGWQPAARQLLSIQAIKTAVKMDVIQVALYRPRGWSALWALAVVVGPAGESWWTFELNTSGTMIKHAEEISLSPGEGYSISDRTNLASLDRAAVQLLSFRVTARRLDLEKKAYSVQSDVGQVSTLTSPRRVVRWVQYLQTSDILSNKLGEKSWLQSQIAITWECLKITTQEVWHIATGKMTLKAAADMQKLMASSPRSSFKLFADGRFHIHLITPFGQDILEELRGRLHDLNRLRSFACVLQKRQMRIGTSSLQRIQFQYGPSPFVAAVDFSDPKKIQLTMSSSNPHHRIHFFLTSILNNRLPSLPFTPFDTTSGLDYFCSTLILTRSLLNVFDELDNAIPGNTRNPAIHAHSMFKYRIIYENPVCSFDVHLAPKGDKVFWVVEDNMRMRAIDMRPTPERDQDHRRLDNLVAKLKEVCSQKGQNWFGTRNGMVAEVDGIAAAIRTLHETVLACKMEGGYVAPPPLEPAVATKANASAGQRQVNGAPQAAQQQQARPHNLQQAQTAQRKQIQRAPVAQMNGRPQGMQQRPGGFAQGRAGQGRHDAIQID